jgi:hypothetical protein
MNYLARFFAVVVMTCFLLGCCPNPSSKDGAAKARALTKSQLHALYTDMQRFNQKGKYIVWGGERSPIPNEFARVGAVSGDVGHLNRLIFGGCMDDKASLIFDGLNGTGPKRIRLFPGEMIPDEVLWEEGDSANIGRPLPSGAEPNYAIKGTSVETLDSNELSSGASVPYLGC